MPGRLLILLLACLVGVAMWAWIPFGKLNDVSEVAAIEQHAPRSCAVGEVDVTADPLNLRSLPVNGNVIGLLDSGAHVTATRCAARWAYIEVAGWVYAAYLRPVVQPRVALGSSNEAQAATKPPARDDACTTGANQVGASFLNVRMHPVDGSVLGRLATGTDVTVWECRDAWARVGAVGWVHADYLSPTVTEKTTADNESTAPKPPLIAACRNRQVSSECDGTVQ